jgi:hypothetical protein
MMGQIGHERVRAFTPERMVSGYEALYCQIADGTKSLRRSQPNGE